MRYCWLIVMLLLFASCKRKPDFVAEGFVLEEGTGKAVSGATVSLFEADCFLGCTESLVAQALSDEDGHFRFELDHTSNAMSISATASGRFPGARAVLDFSDGHATQDCGVIGQGRFRVLFTGQAGFSYLFLHTNRVDLNHPNQLAASISTGLADTTDWMEVYGGFPTALGVLVNDGSGQTDTSFTWQFWIPPGDSLTLQGPF